MKQALAVTGAILSFLCGGALVISCVVGGAALARVFRAMGEQNDIYMHDTYILLLNVGGAGVEVNRWVMVGVLAVQLTLGLLLLWCGKVLLARGRREW